MIGPYPCCSVVQGDCLELMKSLPDGCVDAVITDPPYGVNLGAKANNQRFDRLEYDSIEDSPQIVWWAANVVLPEAIRISKRVILTPGTRNIYAYPPATHVGSFFYPAASGCNSWGFSCWQPILYYGKDPHGGKGSKPDSTQSAEAAEPNGHPCPKPIGQWLWLMERTTMEGETIIDPFIGSGTTAVAAKKLGRHFLGFEISETYCEIARDRLARIDAQPSLFEPKPEQLSLNGGGE
jgi:site-specific DNA-methyltransferase (adenine-specific)